MEPCQSRGFLCQKTKKKKSKQNKKQNTLAASGPLYALLSVIHLLSFNSYNFYVDSWVFSFFLGLFVGNLQL